MNDKEMGREELIAYLHPTSERASDNCTTPISSSSYTKFGARKIPPPGMELPAVVGQPLAVGPDLVLRISARDV